MNTYLIHSNNVAEIQFQQDDIMRKCKKFANAEYSIYQYFSFIDGTGYMKTVRDEIEFVLSSYQEGGICFLDFDTFVSNWNFIKYLDYDLDQLSGGWKKYLGLALFTNQISEGKIYFDACRQLSDTLIDNFVKNVRQTQTKNIFFCEYDNNLMLPFNFTPIYISEKEIQINKIEFTNHKETNYELLGH